MRDEGAVPAGAVPAGAVPMCLPNPPNLPNLPDRRTRVSIRKGSTDVSARVRAVPVCLPDRRTHMSAPRSTTPRSTVAHKKTPAKPTGERPMVCYS